MKTLLILIAMFAIVKAGIWAAQFVPHGTGPVVICLGVAMVFAFWPSLTRSHEYRP